MISYYAKAFRNGYDHLSTLSIYFCVFFFVRCACIRLWYIRGRNNGSRINMINKFFYMYRRGYDHLSTLSTYFCVFFFVRCACIHFGAKSVPNPWIVDAGWYFSTMLGVLLSIILMAALKPSPLEWDK